MEALEPRLLLSVSNPAPFPNPSEVGASLLDSYPTIAWDGGEYAYTGNWIARFDGDGAVRDLSSSFKAFAADNDPLSDIQVTRTLGRNGFTLLDVPAAMGYDDLYQSLSVLPGFQYVEPDFVVTVDAFPNDPQFNSLWGLNNTGQTGGTPDADIDAPEAWDVTTGSSDLVVGVIDTGVDYTHPDLASNMWTNPGEIAGNGIDDDGNGFTDDVFGWDFANNDNDPFDDHGHGTHVSGTIGATGNNSLGVVGVNWDVQIMALKFIAASGTGSTADAVAAIEYATMMRTDFNVDIRVTNNSWGGGGFSQAVEDAIAASGDAGMLFVAAAGNDSVDNDAFPNYPSSHELDNIIAVASTDHNDNLSFFSSFGATSVDLAAPGENILSTVPGGGYGFNSGTSMATPHVTGAVALAWSRASTLAASQIRDAILNGVDLIAGLSGITATGGRLNVANVIDSLGMHVAASNPADGEVVTTMPVDFVVHFSEAYLPGSVDAGDFSVNATTANSFTPTDTDTVTFHFTTSPVATQGLQIMAIAEDTIFSKNTGKALQPWTASFRYDLLRMEVVSTSPAVGSLVALPLTQIEVTFNEAYDPASLGAGNLTLSRGTVTAAEVVDVDTARYTLSGITEEMTLNVDITAGALTDPFGNPILPFTGNYSLDTTVTAATPFERLAPLGGLILVSRDNKRLVSFSGDDDDFAFFVEAGESISAVVTPENPAATLSLELVGVSSGHSASSPGEAARLPSTVVAADSTVQVRVSGDVETSYTLTIYRNAAVESIDTAPGSELSLDDSFLSLGSGRYAALGTSEPSPLSSTVVFEAHFDTGLEGFTVDNNFGTGGGLWHASTGRSADGLVNHSPPGSLYYGQSEGPTGGGHYFQSGLPNGGAVVSPLIALPDSDEITFRFNHFLETEDFAGFDVAEVAVSTGGAFTTILSSATGSLPTGTGGVWDSVSVDLSSFAGQEVRLRFRFDTFDEINNGFEGWYVDDVVINAVPNAPDVDLFTLDLTGKTGRSLDVILAGQDKADFSGAMLEWLDVDGTTVLASGSSGSATNYDVGILGFVVPAGGVYTIRVSSALRAEYGLIVTDSLLFDSEPNDKLTDPLRSLNSIGGAIGHLGIGTSLLFVVEQTAGSPQIHTVDPVSGVLVNSFPAPAAPATQEFGLNLAFDGTHLWYNAGTITGDSTIFRLDPQTGDVLGSFVASQTLSPLGLGYAAGELFVVDFDLFFFEVDDIDVYDATTFAYKRSLSVPVGLGLTGLTGDDANGSLYGVDQFTNVIYQFDAATGQVTNSFATGLGGEQGLAVVGDELIVSDAGSLGLDNRIVVFDPVTMTEVRRFDLPLGGTIGGLGGDGAAATFAAAFSSPATATAVPEPGGDLYAITLATGQDVTLATETPFDDQAGFPVNQLDPRLVVFDPTGAIVAADNNSAADGKNATVSFQAAQGGVYTIQVLAESGKGEYVLKAGGSSAVNPIDFNSFVIEPYSGPTQDLTGTAVVEDAGATLHLTGNTWKKIALPYNVTPNTVLEFDFKSTSQGEVHGIGFDIDDAISADQTFRLYGTQDWGIASFTSYASAAPGWKHFTIPVGHFLSGQMQSVTFTMDHDSGATGDSFFSNLTVYESTLPPTVDFSSFVVRSYGGPGQDLTGSATVEDEGATLHLTGNRWKKVALPYNVTPNTVLEFDFKSTSQGEVHGIGLDTDNTIGPGQTFQLYGTQDWGISSFTNYSSAAPAWKHYTIPVGLFFSGAMDFLTFTMDHDTGATGESFFSNVSLYESPALPAIDFSSFALQSYASQAKNGTGEPASGDPTTLELNGNVWKTIPLPYHVTPDTVLEFDFTSSAQGEVHGIGFDDDNVFHAGEQLNQTFRVFGSQVWGIGDFADYGSVPLGSTKHYTIPVGQYLTGAFEYLVFAMDHDVASPAGNSVFSNVAVYENTASPSGAFLANEETSGPSVSRLAESASRTIRPEASNSRTDSQLLFGAWRFQDRQTTDATTDAAKTPPVRVASSPQQVSHVLTTGVSADAARSASPLAPESVDAIFSTSLTDHGESLGEAFKHFRNEPSIDEALLEELSLETASLTLDRPLH